METEVLCLPAPEEIFPAVDSDDKVIMVVSGKDKLHQEDHIHRGIHILVETDHAGFVLQKKAEGTENAGKWSSAVSGHVKYNESYIAAAVREAKEELDLDIDGDELTQIAYVHPCEETGNEFVSLYSYLIDEEDVIDLKSDEVESVLICPRTEVIADIQSQGDRYSKAFILLFNMFLAFEG